MDGVPSWEMKSYADKQMSSVKKCFTAHPQAVSPTFFLTVFIIGPYIEIFYPKCLNDHCPGKNESTEDCTSTRL